MAGMADALLGSMDNTLAHRPTVRRFAKPRPPRTVRVFNDRTDRVPLIVGAALRHYTGAEKTEILDVAYRLLLIETTKEL